MSVAEKILKESKAKYDTYGNFITQLQTELNKPMGSHKFKDLPPKLKNDIIENFPKSNFERQGNRPIKTIITDFENNQDNILQGKDTTIIRQKERKIYGDLISKQDILKYPTTIDSTKSKIMDNEIEKMLNKEEHQKIIRMDDLHFKKT